MGEFLDQVPESVRGHIRQITKTSGLPDTDESVEQIARGWLEKRDSFDQQLSQHSMQEIDFLARDEERGALVMTYSGSLLNIGPLATGGRKTEYASIGLRQDVPEMAEADDAQLSSDLAVDEEAVFAAGPITKSSPIYKIAVPPEDMEPEEQEQELAAVTQVLTEEFVEVNKTIAL